MINTKIAIVCESQLVLITLMEGISTWLDMAAETKPPSKEFIDTGAERLARAWDSCFVVERIRRHKTYAVDTGKSRVLNDTQFTARSRQHTQAPSP